MRYAIDMTDEEREEAKNEAFDLICKTFDENEVDKAMAFYACFQLMMFIFWEAQLPHEDFKNMVHKMIREKKDIWPHG